MYISVDSPELDIIVFNISVIISKKKQIMIMGNSNYIIGNLPFVCEFSAMKEVVDDVLYHTNHIKDYHGYNF